MDQSLAEKIDALLPQTQCTQCGFSGCMPYAQAIVDSHADINQCPPGGAAGISKLALLLGVEEKPLNQNFGSEQPRKVAFIIEADCIGCTKCLPPCPVDSILGANKYMHTIITEQCTGCELCIAPCPVDCIIMTDLDRPEPWGESYANNARHRYQNKQLRLQAQAEKKAMHIKKKKEKIRLVISSSN